MTLSLDAALRAAMEAEALAEKASPPPWHDADRGVGFEVHFGPRPELGCWHPDIQSCAELNNGFRDTMEADDAAFIAHARTAVPLLARYVREMAGEVERLRAESDEMYLLLHHVSKSGSTIFIRCAPPTTGPQATETWWKRVCEVGRARRDLHNAAAKEH